MSLMTHTRERNLENKVWSGSPLKVPEGARFLIVCDDNSDADRLKVILREAGFVSEWAKSITEGCEAAKSGRFQVVAGPVEWILDIAHNEPAARVFAEHVRERPLPGGGHTFAVVGILADKDAREIAAALEPLVDHWILCSLPGPRGSSASDLAQRLRLQPDDVTLATSVEEGCEVARAAAVPGDRVIVFGSVYTVGPALQWLRVY